MNIRQIKSIELDRSKPFNHKVLIKDETGYVMQEIKVEESKGWEQFALIYKAWCEHPDFNGANK